MSNARPDPAATAAGPEELWLQLYGDSEPDDSAPPDYTDDVSWCWHRIYDHDVRYVRADLVAEAVAAEREACALIVCPEPHVEEERECASIAALIRARQDTAAPAGEPLRERTLLEAASHALRSYQYGNDAPDLAKDLADKIDAALAAPAGEPADVRDALRYHWLRDAPDVSAVLSTAIPQKRWDTEIDAALGLAAPAGEPRLTELDIVTAAGPYWAGKTLAEVLYGIACAVGPMPAWANAGRSMRGMFELAAERVLELVNIALRGTR